MDSYICVSFDVPTLSWIKVQIEQLIPHWQLFTIIHSYLVPAPWKYLWNTDDYECENTMVAINLKIGRHNKYLYSDNL